MGSTDYYKKGNGPHLILLHGWQQNRDSWGQAAADLTKYFTCWFLDLPAFGENNTVLADKSPLGYSQWLNDFISRKKLKNTFVVGHSFGGRIAVISTCRNKAIKKLVLYSAPVLKNETKINKTIGIFKKAGIKNVPLVSDLLRSEDYRNTNSLTREIFLEAVNFDLKNYLKEIKIPTLILAGENDTEVPLGVCKETHEIIKNSDLYIFPNCGHFAHLEKPVLFAAKMKNFLLK